MGKTKRPAPRIIVDEAGAAELLAELKARRQAKIQEASRLLRLVGCETRLRILLFLGRANSGAAEVRAEIGEPSDQAISHQCSQLVSGGLAARQNRGKTIVYSLTPLGKMLVGLLEGLSARPGTN